MTYEHSSLFDEEYLLFQLRTGYVVEFNLNGEMPESLHGTFLYIGHAMQPKKGSDDHLMSRLVKIGPGRTASGIGTTKLEVLRQIEEKLNAHR